LGTPQVNTCRLVATLSAALPGGNGVCTASSAQKASSACAAWRGCAATMAPLSAPIEMPATMSG
jgi:hypothetical protein